MAKKWIQKAITKPGALRKALKVKKGKDIPEELLEKTAKKKTKKGKLTKLARRARLAETLKGFSKKK